MKFRQTFVPDILSGWKFFRVETNEGQRCLACDLSRQVEVAKVRP
jgi:hypothetical protein